MSCENLKIIHAPTLDSPFLIVFKPAHIPSAPLFEGDRSILSEAAKAFPEIALVHGKKEVEHGLVHRIDTETSGLVLIATSQESYNNLIQSQKAGKFEKWYRAEVEPIPDCAERLGGFPPFSRGEISNTPGMAIVKSAFRSFGKNGREVRPVAEGAGKAALKKSGSVLYQTEISFEVENTALCHITAGFRHQVRCHLAWRGFPVKGDKIYNPNVRENIAELEPHRNPELNPCRNLELEPCRKSDVESYRNSVVEPCRNSVVVELCRNHNSGNTHDMCFTACKISFPHPLSGEILTFEIIPER